MPKTKVAVTLETKLLDRVDELVAQELFRNRSQAIEAALAEKLQRLARTRLAEECTSSIRRKKRRSPKKGHFRNAVLRNFPRRHQGSKSAVATERGSHRAVWK